MRPGFYKQTDSRWFNYSCSTKDGGKPTLGAHGCGATTCANVLSVLKGSKWTPKRLFKWACVNGYMTSNQGLYWGGIVAMLKLGGVSKVKETTSDEEARKALDHGDWVIALMGKGNWTNGGHFVLAYELKDGFVHVSDPASFASGRAKAPWSLMASQNIKYWIIDLSGYQLEAKKKKWAARLAKTRTIALYTKDLANVRALPSKKSKCVALLDKGVSVKLKKLNENWYCIAKGKWMGYYIRINELSKYKQINKTYEALEDCVVRTGYSNKTNVATTIAKGTIVVSKKQRGNWVYLKKQSGVSAPGWVLVQNDDKRYMKKI